MSSLTLLAPVLRLRSHLRLATAHSPRAPHYRRIRPTAFSTHAFHKIQPKRGMWTRSVHPQFVFAVHLDRTAKLIIFHAHAEFFEIRGERLHMMEIVSAVPSQVFPRQL